MSEYDEIDTQPDETTEEDTGETVAVKTRPVVKPGKPQFFKVVLTHPNHNNRTVFRSVSETRARKWLQDHYPRGSEAHLVAPDGTIEHFETERRGENGMDADQWQPFDPSTWEPVDQMAPPGESEWADKEG